MLTIEISGELKEGKTALACLVSQALVYAGFTNVQVQDDEDWKKKMKDGDKIIAAIRGRNPLIVMGHSTIVVPCKSVVLLCWRGKGTNHASTR